MSELAALLPLAGAWGSARVADPVTRAVLHVRQGRDAGLEGPMLRAEPAHGGWALRLGPEEWLLLGATLPPVAVAHSLVDVSDRQVALELDGPGAAPVLAGGVPIDLDARAFRVGGATRTLCGKAEIVLWRRAEQRWHIEVWRSFAPYVARLLAQSAADLVE